MIASLPMYWRAENAADWQAFWSLVQSHAPALSLPDLTAPDALPANWLDHWLSADLALSQTCGLPFRTLLKDKVTYIGTLDFGLDAPASHYLSHVITRPGQDLSQPLRLAFNQRESQSGWGCIGDRGPENPRLRFSSVTETGAHAESLAAVVDGRADVAWIDAITWRLLQRHDPRTDLVTIIGQTAPTPGQPMIAARGTDPAPLRDAIARAVADLPQDTTAALGGLKGFTVLAPEAYYAVPDLSPEPA